MRIKNIKDAEFIVELIRHGLIPVFNDENKIVFWDDYFTYVVPVTEDNTWYGECQKQMMTIWYNWAFDFFDIYEECIDAQKEFVSTSWGPKRIIEFLLEDKDYINPVIERWDENYLKNKLKARKRMEKLHTRKEIIRRINSKKK